MSRIVLHLPGLTGPVPTGPSADAVDPRLMTTFFEGLDLAVVDRWLRGGRFMPAAIDGETFEDQLCTAFQLQRHVDRDWPVGAITASLDQVDAGDAWCMRADPVHLRPDLRDVHLLPGTELAISDADARQLLDDLNAHFEPDPWRFEAGSRDRWYLICDQELAVRTCAPGALGGQRLESRLPTGPDAAALHRLMNEAQMVLHASEANRDRAGRGLPPVNGVWCWGAGRTPPIPVPAKWSAVWTDDLLTAALVANGGGAARPLASLADDLASRAPDSGLIVSGRGQRFTANLDVEGWRGWLEQCLVDILGAVDGAMSSASVEQVALSWGVGWQCEVRRGDRWRWWRRGPPLAELANRLAQNAARPRPATGTRTTHQ